MNFFNRRTGRVEVEDVYGSFGVRLLYGNPFGFALADSILVRKAVSRFYGALQSRAITGGKVPQFIKKFRIPMEQYEPGPYRSFNDFFIRKFKEGQRSFPTEQKVMGAFAEARYLAFKDISHPISIPVKGLGLDPMSLLGNTPGKERFRAGPCLLARLCPVDYHRYHFPDNGRISHQHIESGKLHSVNPMALQRHPELFFTNERQVSLLETENFGTLAYVEVGALCVGKIVETHPAGQRFLRGAEKGYFLFGGSTVILYGEPGAWEPEADLLKNSAEGLETLVELGSPVAKAKP